LQAFQWKVTVPVARKTRPYVSGSPLGGCCDHSNLVEREPYHNHNAGQCCNINVGCIYCRYLVASSVMKSDQQQGIGSEQHGNVSKGMDDGFPIQTIPFIFQEVNSWWYFPINCYLLIFNGHGSHVTLKAIKQAMDIRLDMITLLSQTSHAFQPLDISCFKPFKTTF
jgi:hypothetical protein